MQSKRSEDARHVAAALEDQLRSLVTLWRTQADMASRAADRAAKLDHYQEGIEGGKMMAYREVALVLENVLDRSR